MIGAEMILTGKWSGAGVFNMEQNDPDPFMEELNKRGLPWHCIELSRKNRRKTCKSSNSLRLPVSSSFQDRFRLTAGTVLYSLFHDVLFS